MNKLTISQALRRVKKLKGKLSELRARGTKSVTFQEGKRPAFSFSSCLEDTQAVRKELIVLETQIAFTNAATTLEWRGELMALAFAIRTLAEYKSEIAWLKSLPVRAEETTEEETWEYDEEAKRVKKITRFTCHLTEDTQVNLMDEIQDNFDALNSLVESMNHQTLLVGHQDRK
jgi:hypothetical protein